jgi:transposase
VTGGLDWARDDHAVAVVDARGRELARHRVEHSAPGLTELIEVLRRANWREVAIERPDGPVVDTLLGAGLTVVVISPNQVKNLRGHHGSAGNKDDRLDAYVLADTLRIDRARLRALVPDSQATVALRRVLRARRDSPSPIGSASRTSCGHTCVPCSPAQSACSPRSIPRSVWRS